MMNNNLRKYYDNLIEQAKLKYNEQDFEQWYYENYQVSSSVHPSGMFSNDREYIEYDNKISWQDYCDNNNIDPESQHCLEF
jgi:hypothetical protein